jgi:hypothetical protein
VTPEKSDRCDAWEAGFRQRFGTLQPGSGNGASRDRRWHVPAAKPQQAHRRPAIVSSLGMITALLLGLVLGALLWRDRAGVASIRVVTQTSVAASPSCREAVDRLERRLAPAVETGRNPTLTTGMPSPAAAAGQPAGSEAVLADYRNMAEQCGLR